MENPRIIRLADIIQLGLNHWQGDLSQKILWEKVAPYAKMVNTYFEASFGCDVAFWAIDVYNAAQYGYIVPLNELTETIENYISEFMADEHEDDKKYVRELAGYQFFLLRDYINRNS